MRDKNRDEPYFKEDSPDIREGIKVITIADSRSTELPTFCPICKKRVFYDDALEGWVCKACPFVMYEGYGAAPIHGELELHAGNDPYDAEGQAKAYFKSFRIGGDPNQPYNIDNEKDVFQGSPQEAMADDAKKVRELNRQRVRNL